MKVPTYQSQRLQTEFSERSVQSAGSTEGTLARGLGQVAGALFKVDEDRRNARDAMWVSEKRVDLRSSFEGKIKSLQEQFIDDPIEKNEILTTELRKIKDEFSKQSPSSQAKATIETIANSQIEQYNSSWNEWSDKQLRRTNLTKLDQITEKLSTQSYEAGSVDRLKFNVSEMEKAFEGIKFTVSTPELEQVLGNAKKDIMVNGINGMIDRGSIAEAEAALKDDNIKELLGAKGQSGVRAAIDAKKAHILSVENKFIKLQQSDPYEFLSQKHGIQPTDITEIEEGAFSRRQRWREQMDGQFGIKTPLFTNKEAKIFTTLLTETQPDQRKALFLQMDKALTSDQKRDLSAQIFKTAPEIGVAVSIGSDDNEMAGWISEGKALIDKNAVAMPAPKEFQTDVNEYVGRALMQPQMRQGLIEASRAAYAKMAVLAKKEDGQYDPDFVNKKILPRILGPIIEINDLETISFRSAGGEFVDEDDFEDLWENAKFKGFDRNNKEIPLEKIKQYGKLISVGDGLYSVIFKDDDYVADKTGRPLVVDLRNQGAE